MDRATPQPTSRLTLVLLILIGAALSGLTLVLLDSVPGSRAGLGALAPAAFVAGLLSFLSPCTLPLLPAYGAFALQARPRTVERVTVLFFLGLATSFAMLGAGAFGLARYLPTLTVLGGALVMAFGALSLLGLGLAGPQARERPGATLVGAYLLGAAFALGWTACVGPILGIILTLLAGPGLALVQGTALAGLYALGLGAPLIAAAAAASRLGAGFWLAVRGREFELRLGAWTLSVHTTSVLSGVLLIVMGYLLASGQLALLSRLGANADLTQWVIQLETHLHHWLGLP